MNWIINFIVGFGAAFIGALGMGGGAVLLIYLTCVAGVSQLTAQGLNLLFFLPIAIVALIIHIKNKLIDYKVAIQAIIGGVIGVFIGKFIADKCGDNILQIAFAIFLLFLGIKELFTKSNNTDDKKS